MQGVGSLLMREARGITGRLGIDSEVDHGEQHLGMALRLLAPAHESKGHPGLAALHHESRQQSVKRTLARRDHVGTLRIQGEQRAPVVEYESVPGNSDT